MKRSELESLIKGITPGIMEAIDTAAAEATLSLREELANLRERAVSAEAEMTALRERVTVLEGSASHDLAEGANPSSADGTARQ